jgi:acyl-coenzyme A thioesterase PaaI-like protein
VQQQTSFLRPIAADSGSATVSARVLRMGRRIVFGEVHVADARGELAAHATTTYALL